MATYGPTILSELSAAGCSDGIGINFGLGQAIFAPHTPDDGLTDDQYAARLTAQQRVLAAHDPAKALPPDVAGDTIIGAIAKTDRAKCDPTDLARIAWRDDVPNTNNKLARIAKALGTTPDALRQTAMGN